MHEARFRVRYAETDQMGVVYYANYLIWMELGRVEYCRQAGIRYRDMEAEDGILLAVAEAHCRYLQPARYDDEIIVETSVSKAHARMIVFEYAIRRGDGQLLATGQTKHIFCGRDFQPRRLPAKYYSAFGVDGRVARPESFGAL
jgi:acyl-CoA thioester hydrolase